MEYPRLKFLSITTILSCIAATTFAIDVNWCVTSIQEERYCNDMSGDVTTNYQIELNIRCVYEFNKYACMRLAKDRTNEIWLIGLDPEDAYVAARYHGLQPLVRENYQLGSRDYAVAVIRNPDRGGNINKISDLQGKKSCHPDLDYIVGWNIPYARLVNSMTGIGDCDAALNNTAQFFSQSCAPGTWAMDIDLKNSLPTLCELCKDNNCGRGGSYAQLQGAVQCLKTSGDVAFTTYSAAKKEIQSTELTNYALLCTRVTTTNKQWAHFSDYDTCNWAKIPGHLIMTRGSIAEQQKNEMASLLKLIYTVGSQAGVRPSWFDNFFLSDTINDVENKIIGLTELLQDERNDYKKWLDEGFRWGMNLDEVTSTGQCGGVQQQIDVGLCVISAPELHKCEELRDAMISKRIRPVMKCVEANDYKACVGQVSRGAADIVNLNAGYIYYAGTTPDITTKLVPLAGERFQDDPRNGYYTVVVARSTTIRDHNLNIFRMRGRGFKSCHAFEWDGASWVVAAQRMMDLSQVSVYNCDVSWAFKQFFSGGSCIPGASKDQSDLCKWCNQGASTAQRCKISQEDPFFNHVGAFRCLAANSGDVAFTKHLVPSQNTNYRNLDEWARELTSGEFQLMCADGSVRDIDSGSQCNLNFVPANHLMVSDKISSTKRIQLWRMLDTMQRFFGSQKFMQENEGTWTSAKFHMFESKWLTPDILDNNRNFTDLIFTDSVYKLEPVPWNNTYRDIVSTSTGAYNFEVMCRQSDYNKPGCWRRSAASTTQAFIPSLITLTSILVLLLQKHFARA